MYVRAISLVIVILLIGIARSDEGHHQKVRDHNYYHPDDDNDEFGEEMIDFYPTDPVIPTSAKPVSCTEYHDNKGKWRHVGDLTLTRPSDNKVTGEKAFRVRNKGSTYHYAFKAGVNPAEKENKSNLYMETDRFDEKGLGQQFKIVFNGDGKDNVLKAFLSLTNQACSTDSPFDASKVKSITVYALK